MADQDRIIHADASSGEYEPKVQDPIEEHDNRNHSISRRAPKSSMAPADRARINAEAKLANPLAGYSHAELRQMARDYVKKYQIGGEEDIRAFEIGACLAQDPSKHNNVEGLNPQEKEVLGKELSNRWSQPKLMYLVIVLCSVCAAVQGMGEHRGHPSKHQLDRMVG